MGADMDAIILDQIECMLACRSTQALSGAIETLARKCGFDHWIYVLDVPHVESQQQPVMLGTYPADWVKHYFASDYLRVDPVISHCHAHDTPFLWPSSSGVPAPEAPQAYAQWRLFQEAREFGLNSGISIPLHGLGCAWGLLSLTASAPMDLVDLRALTPSVQLFAHYVHEIGHRLVHGAKLAPRLTSRELECLKWGAEGKTSWEIAQSLGTSERTVVFHFQNAARKFAVSSRQPAIARAVALGLINL